MGRLTNAFVAAEQPAMTSREIAELVGARPDSARRTIERLADKGVITLPPLVEKPTDGRSALEYVFTGERGKRDSIIVVAQMSPEFTARLVDRWQELEASTPPAPVLALNDPVALRAALLGYTEQVIALEAANVELEHQIEEIAPKAAIYDKYLNADGLMSLQDLGRALGQGPNKFIERLKGKWLFESRGTLIPHSRFADEGIKIFTVKSRMYGEKLRRQTMATPKAIPYFAKKLGTQPSGTAH